MSDKRPIWAGIAEAYRGVHEVPGPGDNPVIVEFLRIATRGKVLPDSLAWCSAFGSTVMLKAGFKPTYSLAARDWLKDKNYRRLSKPRPWCLAVYDREDPNAPDWQGHFCFWLKNENGKDRVYGGNQNDQVGEMWIDESLRVAFLWPSNYVILQSIERIARIRYKQAVNDSLKPVPKTPDIKVRVPFYAKPKFIKFTHSFKYLGYIVGGILQYMSGGAVAIGKGMTGLIELTSAENIAELEPDPDKEPFIRTLSELIARIIKYVVNLFKKRTE